MTIRLDEFELSPDAYELRADGQPLAVEPQLLDNVWGDRFVSESALTSRIKTARQILGDTFDWLDRVAEEAPA